MRTFYSLEYWWLDENAKYICLLADIRTEDPDYADAWLSQDITEEEISLLNTGVFERRVYQVESQSYSNHKDEDDTIDTRDKIGYTRFKIELGAKIIAKESLS